VLGDGSAGGAQWLENADRGLAAAVMGKVQPARGAACLRRVRAGTAAELLRAPGIPDAWLAEVLAKLPVRLRAALLDRVAIDSQAAAGPGSARLSGTVGGPWRPAGRAPTPR
jgi:hypothetical protein